MRDSDNEDALHARRAESFGSKAAEYARYRPDYPVAAITWALEPVRTGNSDRPIRVLDLGAGTGKLTAGVLATGADVTTVEPDDAMRTELIKLLPQVRSLSGRAEAIPLPDGSMDAVLIGQAFHWFDAARALPEIARVLRPGGTVGALWNIEDSNRQWVAELQRFSRSSVSTPPSVAERNRAIPKHPAFGRYEWTDFRHSQRHTPQSLTETIGTHSHVLVLPGQERIAVLERIRRYLDSCPETTKGEFDLPLITITGRCVKAG